MQLAILASLALALAGSAYAKPTIASHGTLGEAKATNVSIVGLFPVHDLAASQASAKADVTLSTAGGLSLDAANADFPATMFLCQAVNCASCVTFDLSALPHQTCLTASFNFVSVAISQPSNSGLDFGVFVGPPGCASFAQLPNVNQCFNLNFVATQLVLSP